MMKKTICILFLSIIIPFLCFSQKKDEKAIRKTFEKYKKAVINDNGKQAMKCIDKETLNYFEELLENVKKADSIKLESLPLFTKLMVLTFRHSFSVKEILAFDTEKLFLYNTEGTMTGKNGIEQVSIGTIAINGNLANGNQIIYREETHRKLNFSKENRKWKLNLLQFIPTEDNDKSFIRIVEEDGFTVNEHLFLMLESTNGKKVSPDIWNPLIK